MGYEATEGDTIQLFLVVSHEVELTKQVWPL